MEERRSHSRLVCQIAITYQVVGSGTTRDGLITDLGMGGVFIEASPLPPFAAELRIHARFPGHALELTLPGVVRWVRGGGFGVQFGLLGARETHELAQFLRTPA